ncbi:phytoene/squalene synthase family protein [Peribacillus frigoritolerans]|uniref:phytoene/squalene synthase family protein n=1 Tax=Peribacillus frigoritolerans TaxID=450367 RepID=UPI00105A2400|nr:phytoene/squalene synthase family protein [Peribacillus frigoritolerans]TDL80705.1 phytoene/squalene synthase family protein [Peribacillus frigoritolerans]
MVDLNLAYKQCEEVIQHHSKTFYKAFSLLPSKKRKAVWAVYAFCRIVDDIVDEGKKPKEELREFQEEFEGFLKGSFSHENFMWVALHDTFKQYEMDIQAFRDMIKGQGMDLVKIRYHSMDEVLDYSYHVASTVGLMLLPILAPRKIAVLREGAIALGLGMQLTNILRDIGEDLGRDRIYLPKDIMQKHHLTEMDLQKQTVTPEFISVWEHLAAEAEKQYDTAMLTMNEYPIHARAPVKAAGHFYRAILNKIRLNDYDVFGERNFVSNEEKHAILSQI